MDQPEDRGGIRAGRGLHHCDVVLDGERADTNELGTSAMHRDSLMKRRAALRPLSRLVSLVSSSHVPSCLVGSRRVTAREARSYTKGRPMSLFRSLVLALALTLGLVGVSVGQSPPIIPYPAGAVWTPGQVAQVFSAKMDYTGSPPLLLSGGAMVGKVYALPSAAATGAGLNLGIGVSPVTAVPGDIWINSTGLWYANATGGEVGPFVTSSLLSLPTVTAGGTSGGVLYLPSGTSIASSGVLGLNQVVIGGGPGSPPTSITTAAGTLSALQATPLNTGSFTPQNGAITNNNCLKWSTASGVTDAGGACNAAAALTGLGANVGTALALGVNANSGLMALTASGYIPAIDKAGITTGANASVGLVGEMLVSDVPVGSYVALTTGSTAYNITSVSLSAGDWNCNASAIGLATATGISFWGWLSTSSATIPTVWEQSGAASCYEATYAGDTAACSVGPVFYDVSGSQTIYLSMMSATASEHGYGQLQCRRMR